MGSDQKRNYQAINGSIIIPKLNVTVEDLFIAICPAMLGNGIGSIISFFSHTLGIFVTFTGISGSLALFIFAYKKRAEEIKQRGYSRSGILRRYLAYFMGNDWLRCR